MERNSGWKSCFRSIGLCPKMHSAALGADMEIVNSQMLGFGSLSKKSRILELTVSPLGGAGIWPMIKGASTTFATTHHVTPFLPHHAFDMPPPPPLVCVLVHLQCHLCKRKVRVDDSPNTPESKGTTDAAGARRRNCRAEL